MNKEALGNFKGHSQNEGWANFAGNLGASAFNEGLAIGTTFSYIHLDGLCL
jgi:hypothetical protein